MQSIEVPPFPSKMQQITNKVTKYLSQKIYFPDSITHEVTQSNSINTIQASITPARVKEAIDKTQKMNSKLKSIRTILGYEYNKYSKKLSLNVQPQTLSQDIQKQDKGNNLKQFVLSMRKRNEILDKYSKLRRNKNNQVSNGFDSENKNVNEFTNASLKFVHSFLPHNTMIQPSLNKSRKVHSLAPSHQQNQVYSPHIVKFQQADSTSCHLQQQDIKSGEIRKEQHLSKKRSIKYITDPKIENRNKHFTLYTLSPSKDKSLEQMLTINEPYHLVSCDQDNKLKTPSANLEIFTNRTTQLLYRGKYYRKDLHQTIKNQRQNQKILHSGQKQCENEKQFLPIIKPCLPRLKNIDKRSKSP